MTENSRPGRKPRNDIIRLEVRRRLAAGEPLTNRAIRKAVGGSPSTISAVLSEMGLGTDRRSNIEREIQLREHIRMAGAKAAETEAQFKGAKEAGEAMAREIASTLSTVKDAHMMLMRGVEDLRALMVEVRRELAANRPASDPLMDARLKKANAENGKLVERVMELKRLLNDAGIEVY